jgi:hypothetical protein
MMLFVMGCTVETDRTGKPSPDWSRALKLGRASLKQPVALQVDNRQHVHLVWYDNNLHYAHLDQEAQILTSESLNLDLPNPRRPQLLLDHAGTLHLAWLSRDQVQSLYHTTIAPDGAIDMDVSSFTMYPSPGGEIQFVLAASEADRAPSIWHTGLDTGTKPTPLVDQGIDPYAIVDRDGTIHLTWVTERGLTARTIYYATLDNNQLALTPPTGQKLTDFEFSESGVYYGPLIGLDANRVYVIWSVQSLGGGLTPTSAFSYYVAFERGESSVSDPRTITLPANTRPTYQDRRLDSTPHITSLAPADVGQRSGFLNAPSVPQVPQEALPIAFSLLTESSADSQIQLAVAVLDQEEPLGYALSSETESASVMPTLAADQEGNLYLAWIDVAGFNEFSVHYATTAPEARRWLDRTSSQDLALGAADILFGVLSGVGLVPIAGIWSFPAIVWVVVFFIFSGQEEMDRAPTRIGFAIGIIIYVSIKVLLLPGLFAGTPFLHVFPSGMATVVGITVPAIIVLLALLAVYVYTRRAQRATIFKALFIFCLIDIGLTLILYAPGFFGRV